MGDERSVTQEAHIVWNDENFDSAELCIENFDRYGGDYSDGELAIVRQSLEELARLPLDVKCIWPEDYDDMHPELFPPPVGIKTMRP